MRAETFLYVGSVTLIVIVFGALLWFELSEEEPVSIDYSDRFDELESDHNAFKIGIRNSSIDVCFQSGGQWLTDGNGLVWREIDFPVGLELFAKKQAALCIR